MGNFLRPITTMPVNPQTPFLRTPTDPQSPITTMPFDPTMVTPKQKLPMAPGLTAKQQRQGLLHIMLTGQPTQPSPLLDALNHRGRMS